MLTLKGFLEGEELPWYEVLSGKELLETNHIEFVARHEYNPLYYPVTFSFVRKNELVLSTSIGYESDTIFIDFLRWLIDSGACALVLSVVEDKFQLSPTVKAFLSENPFPLLLLPWKKLFADITADIIKRLDEGAQKQSETYENVQKLLLEAYVSGNDLNSAAQIIADKLSGKSIIFAGNGAVKGVSKHFRSKDENSLAKYFQDKTMLTVLSSNSRMYGSIYFEPAAISSALDQNLFIHYLSLPLTLWFDKEQIIQMTSQHAKDDFIWRLTKSDVDEARKLYAEGSRMSFYLGGAYHCIVGKIHLPFELGDDEKFQWLSLNISGIKERIIKLASTNWYVMLTNEQDELILYLQRESHIENVSPDDVLNKIEKALSKEYPLIWFSWGICENYDNPTDFKKCYQNAKLAEELCESIPGKSARFKFEDTILYRAISLLSSDDEILKNLNDVIAPLYAYDKSSGSFLIDTLECYFGACQNISETARLLHLHRNSLLYRLNKIEELTGLSLKNADNVFLLELSIKLHANKLNRK